MDIILIFIFAVISIGLVKGSCPSTCTCDEVSSGSRIFCNLTYLGRIPALPNDTSHLYLNENNISDIEEHAFGNLTSLTLLALSGNPLNCDCSIFAFWSWLIERSTIGTTAKCSNGTLVTSLQSAVLDTCHPDNCQCFNGGKCVAMGYELICDCIGQWTGTFCQESQCTSYDCGFGDCYIEPVNGTAQCLCGDRYVNYCPVNDNRHNNMKKFQRCKMDIMSIDICVLFFFAVVSIGVVKGTCPSTCSCVDDSSGSKINCSSKYLERIPPLTNNTYFLELGFNNITEIDIQFCKEMPQLHTIYINNNLITKVPVNTFVDCEQLYRIDLQYNKIRSIESNTFVNMTNLFYL
ncbi:unnamed protein product [Mytilus edulis]|uniref:EGF-like domain-containing protein n=1 Tax=Mytilus edulis TaxID=6550 RepID=A0A8S3TWU0_MYTED|nr:unnamed protein product [Mytilus edulis]